MKAKFKQCFLYFFCYTKQFNLVFKKGWSEKVKVIMKFPQGKKRGGGGGGGRVLGWIFAGYVPLASQNPYHIIDPILDNFGQMLFLWSQRNQFLIMHLPHFYILTYKNFLLPKIPKMYDPILVTALKMQPPK